MNASLSLWSAARIVRFITRLLLLIRVKRSLVLSQAVCACFSLPFMAPSFSLSNSASTSLTTRLLSCGSFSASSTIRSNLAIRSRNRAICFSVKLVGIAHHPDSPYRSCQVYSYPNLGNNTVDSPAQACESSADGGDSEDEP